MALYKPGGVNFMQKERKNFYILLAILLAVIVLGLVLTLQLERSPSMQRMISQKPAAAQLTEVYKIINDSSNLIENRNLAQAERYLLDALKHYPLNVDIWTQLGTVYYQQDNYEKAAQIFNHILKHQPDNAPAYNNLALSQLKLKQYEQAQTSILNALQLQPKNGEILLNAANLYAVQRKDKAALEYLKRALDRGIRPEDVSGYIELVRLLERPDFMDYYRSKQSEKRNQ